MNFKYLIIALALVIVVSVMRVFEEAQHTGRNLKSKLRESFIKSSTNVICVLVAYYIGIYYNFSEELSLSIGALMGLYGGEVIFEKIEKIIDTWIDKRVK